MTEDRAREEIRTALNGFHAAQKTGDVDAMVDAFTGVPQGITHGMPRSMTAVRQFYEANVEVFKARQADISEISISIAPNPEAYWCYVDGEPVGTGAYAIVEGVKYTGQTGIGVGVPTGRAAFREPLHVTYVMVREDDGKWRIVSDWTIPDPDGEAFPPELLADAGTVLDNQTMAWTRKLDAPVGKVWEAVTTPEGLRQWWLLPWPNTDFRIDLKGDVFGHVWASRIHELKEGELIDLNELRIELHPDGNGTLLTFVVYSMNGDEWRSFTRVTEVPMYYEQFGGIDPWAATNWHLSLDQLDKALTGRALPYGGLLDIVGRNRDADSDGFQYPPHYHFYLRYLRHLNRLRLLSQKTPLRPVGADQSQFGLPRTEEGYPPPPKRAADAGSGVAGATIEKVNLESQTVLVVEGETDLGGYLNSAAMGIGKVLSYIAEKGITRTGPAFMRNLAVKTDGTIHYAAGVPVAAGSIGDGDIQQRKLPGMTAFMIEFTGDYPQATAGWQALVVHARNEGITLPTEGPSDGGWHAFVNDPREVGSANAVSQLYLPVGKSHDD